MARHKVVNSSPERPNARRFMASIPYPEKPGQGITTTEEKVTVKEREKREGEIRDRLADLFGCWPEEVGDLREALKEADSMPLVTVYWGSVPEYLQ